MGAGGRDIDVIGTAVDVDVAAHGVDAAQAVPARLDAGEPEDAGEDPVAIGVCGSERRGMALTGGAAGDEDGAGSGTGADLGTDDVIAPRGAFTALLLPGAIGGGGHGVGPAHFAAHAQLQALLGGFAASRILEVHGQRMIDSSFTPGGKATTQRKDLQQALDLAASTGLELPATTLSRDLYDRLIAAGGGELDHSGLYTVIDA